MGSSGSRIEWLDGVKGLSCMGVLVHHFCVGFLPATYYGDPACQKIVNNFDVTMAQSPLGVVINGNYMVALFCVVSALVLSLKVMSLENKEELSVIFAKRYPRLMLPLAPVVFLVYFMLRFDCFRNLEIVPFTQSPWLAAYYTQKVSVLQCFSSLFVTIWYAGDDTFSNAFWMLGQLLSGSFLAMILSTFVWKAKKKPVGIVYLFCALLYVRVNSLLLAFVLGVILAYGYREIKGLFGHPLCGVLCLLAGLFLGGYPSGVVPTNVYRYFTFQTYQSWHIIGAVLTIYGIWNIPAIRKCLKWRPFQLLGKLSYSIYIIHIPFLFSVSCYIFEQFLGIGTGYLRSAAYTLGISVVGILSLAYFYYRFIESCCSKLLNSLVRAVFYSDGSK